MVYIFFFWERKSMRAILKKNLIAHKGTNKLTSIIYALTLGCVLFLCVSLNLVINSVSSLSGIPGTDIYVNSGAFSAATLDYLLTNHNDFVKDYSLVSQSVNTLGSSHWSYSESDVTTKQYWIGEMLFGVQPSGFFDDLIDIDWAPRNTTMGVTEQLYTARGSQGMGTGAKWAHNFIADNDDTVSISSLGISNSSANYAMD